LSALESAIYEGQVRHRRFQPIERSFTYRVFMFYLDIEEIPEVIGLHPLVSTRPRMPASFSRSDYLGPSDVPLDDAVRDLVEQRTGRRPTGPVRMLTNLRYWGLIENPVTFYYCFEPSGEKLEAVVAEVTNTPWGDRHAYVVEATEGEMVLSAREDKAMHVSPLMAMDHEYELRFGPPGSRISVHMESSLDDRLFLDATLGLKRSELDRASLSRLLLKYPPMSWRTTFAIHRQAALTWLRGVPFHPRPGPHLSEVPGERNGGPFRTVGSPSAHPEAPTGGAGA
jgi:DUF1365 family protein